MRSSFTLLTEVKGIPTVASVLSVNGCLRTLKVCVFNELKKSYWINSQGQKRNKKEHKRVMLSLQRLIEKIQSLE